MVVVMGRPIGSVTTGGKNWTKEEKTRKELLLEAQKAECTITDEIPYMLGNSDMHKDVYRYFVLAIQDGNIPVNKVQSYELAELINDYMLIKRARDEMEELDALEVTSKNGEKSSTQLPKIINTAYVRIKERIKDLGLSATDRYRLNRLLLDAVIDAEEKEDTKAEQQLSAISTILSMTTGAIAKDDSK